MAFNIIPKQLVEDLLEDWHRVTLAQYERDEAIPQAQRQSMKIAKYKFDCILLLDHLEPVFKIDRQSRCVYKLKNTRAGPQPDQLIGKLGFVNGSDLHRMCLLRF